MTSRKRSAPRSAPKDKQQQAQQGQQQGWQSEQWWVENQELFRHLYEGRSVKEIAQLVGQSERQVKTVKKQLDDLRTATLSLQDVLNLLKYLPHPRVARPPEVMAEFERLMRLIEEEQQDESKPAMRDASSEHDKYIYG